jgi:hypothetical protein
VSHQIGFFLPVALLVQLSRHFTLSYLSYQIPHLPRVGARYGSTVILIIMGK